jgi:hypothetical protein
MIAKVSKDYITQYDVILVRETKKSPNHHSFFISDERHFHFLPFQELPSSRAYWKRQLSRDH